MVIAGLAKTGAWLLASIPIISLWNISMPAAQSMMTHRVSEREQGELQGALQSMRSITFIIGPWLFLRIFGWFIDPKNQVHLPGAPYFLAGGSWQPGLNNPSSQRAQLLPFPTLSRQRVRRPQRSRRFLIPKKMFEILPA